MNDRIKTAFNQVGPRCQCYLWCNLWALCASLAVESVKLGLIISNTHWPLRLLPGKPPASTDRTTRSWVEVLDFKLPQHNRQPWSPTCSRSRRENVRVDETLRRSHRSPSFHHPLLYRRWWWRATELLTRHIRRDSGRIKRRGPLSAYSGADWCITYSLSLWQ